MIKRHFPALLRGQKSVNWGRIPTSGFGMVKDFRNPMQMLSISYSRSLTLLSYFSSSTLPAISHDRSSNIKILIGGLGLSFRGAFEFMKISLSKSLLLKNAVIIQVDDSNFIEEVRDATVVIPFMLKINKNVLNAAPKLKLIIQYGVGLEGVDIVEAKQRGILVGKIASNESANARSCAEHSLFLAMACLRRFNELQNSLRSRVIGYPTGRTLQGTTVVVYGFGGIGRELSPLLKAFGTKVIVIVRDKSQWSEKEIQTLKADYKFDEMYSSSDWSSIEKNLVNNVFLSHTKPGLVLVNVSRGGLIDYGAVMDYIRSGHLGGLGIDVYHTEPFPLPEEDELLRHPLVVSTPHIAGVTESSHGQMASIVVESIESVLKGSPLPFKGQV